MDYKMINSGTHAAEKVSQKDGDVAVSRSDFYGKDNVMKTATVTEPANIVNKTQANLPTESNVRMHSK